MKSRCGWILWRCDDSIKPEQMKVTGIECNWEKNELQQNTQYTQYTQTNKKLSSPV